MHVGEHGPAAPQRDPRLDSALTDRLKHTRRSADIDHSDSNVHNGKHLTRVLVSIPSATVTKPAQSARPRVSGLFGHAPQRSEAGFTLVELLVACSAAMIVLGATVTLLQSSVQVQARDSQWALALQEGRVGMARMARDIRQASKVEEAKASAIVILATIAGKSWKVKYECTVSQPGTEYSECVRLAAEEGKALPSSGQVIARDVLNGSEVFSYQPSATTPTATTIKLELPAKGTLKQTGGSGYKHKMVLEDAAFMRNLYLQG
jgi:type II secretory pathway pseudopilin PulG